MAFFSKKSLTDISKVPTISVVIPLFNHASYIEAALDSVLTQTSPASEIILIDDGSSDKGFEIAERVLRNVAMAKIYRQENAGAHNTLNRAIGICRGEYVAVLNSDDLFLPSKLERCRSIVEQQPSIDLIAGAIEIIDAAGSVQRAGGAIDWLARASAFLKETKREQLSLLNENFVATTSNMVFKRSLWTAAGGFHALRYCHDLDFLMFAYASGSVFLDLQQAHIRYRVHEKNTIGEDLSGIRVEIAAVLAQALHRSGAQLFSSGFGTGDFDAFLRLLRNKQLTEILCFFQSILPAFPDRSDFYDYALSPKLASTFKSAVTS